MITHFDNQLYAIDQQIATTSPKDLPALFSEIPLDIFGQLLLDVPPKFPNIKAFLPSMASDDIQRSWTGSHGSTLLIQSLAFIKTVLSGYEAITKKPVANPVILDYGCGWGRLTRLLYKITSLNNIYAIDPWNLSIEQCREHRVKANLALSEWVPKKLPFVGPFDIIIAFSVFTHLSEKTTEIVLETLLKYVSKDGIVVLTIRPEEYWHIHEQGSRSSEMIEIHRKNGFAFIPHNRPPIDGEVTYGDTSISIEYFATRFPNWRIARVEFNLVDPYQLVLMLTPANT